MMSCIKHILFDLDGVISDNSDGITNGVACTMRHFNIDVPPKSERLKFIGPPLQDSFEEYLGLSHEDAKEGVLVYREYYREHGIFENVMYDGVPELLAKLRGLGFSLYLATSKPEEFAKRILNRFKVDGYFEFIGGATFDGKREKKADVIRYVMNSCGISPDDAVMVGDRHHDVHGAFECSLPCIGVLYGFGSYEELTSAGAIGLAETPLDIVRILNEMKE